MTASPPVDGAEDSGAKPPLPLAHMHPWGAFPEGLLLHRRRGVLPVSPGSRAAPGMNPRPAPTPALGGAGQA